MARTPTTTFRARLAPDRETMLSSLDRLKQDRRVPKSLRDRATRSARLLRKWEDLKRRKGWDL